MNPIHTRLPYYLKINFIIILPSAPRCFERSSPFRLSSHNSVLIFILPHALHALHALHAPHFRLIQARLILDKTNILHSISYSVYLCIHNTSHNEESNATYSRVHHMRLGDLTVVSGLLGCAVVWICMWAPKFRRKILPSLQHQTWKQYVPPKCWFPPTNPHGVTTQNTIVSTLLLNSTYFYFSFFSTHLFLLYLSLFLYDFTHRHLYCGRSGLILYHL
jgi:hypothetical protein